MSQLSITLLPTVTDKSYRLSSQRVYVFTVPKLANKNQIAQAVADQHKVVVEDVRTVVVKGKTKTMVRAGRPTTTVRSDRKKAYVTLAEGNSIKMFEEEK